MCAMLAIVVSCSQAKSFALIFAGSAITPIYQVMQAVLRSTTDQTKLCLIFANRNEDGILLKPELDGMAAKYPDRLRVHYVFSRPKNLSAWLRQQEGIFVNLSVSVGRFDTKLMAAFLPPLVDVTTRNTNYALLCGPDGFITETCQPALAAVGYASDKCIFFKF